MPTLSRCLLTMFFALALAGPAQAFSFNDVARRAQSLSERSYEKPDTRLPKEVADLGYDQYRDIRFRQDQSLWRKAKLPFELQFFHPGLYYNQEVKINLVTAQGVTPFRFNPDYFDYGRNNVDRSKLRDLGYAGFRAHYPLNSKNYKDELIVFLGASYFRALGKGQRYGLSARALAVDTGLMSGEEFPHFNEFWVQAPKAGDQELTIYALLDSKRLTGAYQFRIKPGDTTQIDVRSRVYLREEVGKLGVAPLTSMYFFGENQPNQNADYRPEVHDSDGLLVQTDKEWLWRPLSNPRRLLITSFSASGPRGYGLMQRDRDFRHYEDLEARYEQRPSAWVEPKGNWGPGRVELVQIPTPDETNDNIVAYWVPEQLPAPGKPLDVEYTLHWQKLRETRPEGLARAVQSRYGHGLMRGSDDSIRFHIDFEGGALPDLPDDAKLVGGVWVGDNGEILERQTYRNDVTGGWRISLRVKRQDPEKPLELRAVLRNDKDTLSETWSYILPGEPR
ncbi:glucan biosynthesis protein G [Solimonas sp. K1W22B-7]|uniref:glucan biosynthesis protein G n=1 Tax=Solimonas sp. K1W22B-7 TaxID=2303331 RepID=UPI000E335978|nr:glucan biosynthesis protein G [Solimonas sp. K1W22B-7]AXQ30318.1 glucan biosynthesis protein G [Solimonas sp. K1W22B-7]